ncbi:hypothetical protein [Desulfomarina profundi]|nr:hypothetical protein [Desulfomarina profundi]
MKWNLTGLKFLYPPEDFPGSFSNKLMQERHEIMRKQKIMEIRMNLERAESISAALKSLHPLDHLQFLQNNLDIFRAENALEETVLNLFYRENGSFLADGHFTLWHDLFSECNRERFYSLGQPLPGDGAIAYRGSITDSPSGFCWTISNRKVNWFRKRWQDKDLGGGTIYSTSVRPEDILIYLEKDGEKELIVTPEFLDRATINTI